MGHGGARPPMRPETRIRKFWMKVNKDAPNGCWEWQGKRNNYGYGKVSRHRKELFAHRVSYELCVAPIPEGLVIDHLCKNRCCVNPAHMEVVTLIENTMRGNCPLAQKARQTHCIQGHSLSGSNLRIRKDNHRFCRKCDAMRHGEYRKQKEGTYIPDTQGTNR